MSHIFGNFALPTVAELADIFYAVYINIPYQQFDREPNEGLQNIAYSCKLWALEFDFDVSYRTFVSCALEDIQKEHPHAYGICKPATPWPRIGEFSDIIDQQTKHDALRRQVETFLLHLYAYSPATTDSIPLELDTDMQTRVNEFFAWTYKYNSIRLNSNELAVKIANTIWLDGYQGYNDALGTIKPDFINRFAVSVKEIPEADTEMPEESLIAETDVNGDPFVSVAALLAEQSDDEISDLPDLIDLNESDFLIDCMWRSGVQNVTENDYSEPENERAIPVICSRYDNDDRFDDGYDNAAKSDSTLASYKPISRTLAVVLDGAPTIDSSETILLAASLGVGHVHLIHNGIGPVYEKWCRKWSEWFDVENDTGLPAIHLHATTEDCIAMLKKDRYYNIGWRYNEKQKGKHSFVSEMRFTQHHVALWFTNSCIDPHPYSSAAVKAIKRWVHLPSLSYTPMDSTIQATCIYEAVCQRRQYCRNTRRR